MTEEAKKDGVYFYSMEEENLKLQKQQVENINAAIRKVRRLSKQSQRFARAVVVEEAQSRLDGPGSAGLYVESPGRIDRVGLYPEDEDDTGQFCIPEPSMAETVTAALSQAISQLEKERRSFVSSRNSPVVKRWRIL